MLNAFVAAVWFAVLCLDVADQKPHRLAEVMDGFVCLLYCFMAINDWRKR